MTRDRTKVRPGDRIFKNLSTGAGVFVVALIGLIGLFLLVQAIPALKADNVNFLTSRAWSTGDPGNLQFGILDLLLVTVYSSLVSLVFAMPISLGIALFLTQYAPRRLARPFAYVIDLLAAVPSIIFGLWGILVLAPVLAPVSQWINRTLGWIPVFGQGNVYPNFTGTIFTAGVVLAVMLLPIITSLSREVFERTPTTHIEGALALGATRWEVIRTTVLPFGKAGYIGASMLGLGRALGETIAVTVILFIPRGGHFDWTIFDGGATFASQIATNASEFNNPTSAGAYIASGLVLFVLTFAVNFGARAIIGDKKGD
ncbi:phosphate ABC transporter permease subunit PstC [Amycolatopsis acidiphila]|uniref:Phosphate transport system permease protein n=1 Tax=Amycolatopsis acidiphila TaxID=715473 RepID=A0A558A2H6_9PSEU|nr:phosphate ABC transporter permease subunit PstC [Amycolatopsis acidiphila]TVT18459.1 phosphate ABC transporter permease subunit PstC [Amycolatopsis acidiphila]UIJ60028.1 phosphate ABC transporter permease subunit PstC [Amycolatopsis acidiphila]GHG61772.1 phosphate transport system permease protein [Amycolatopsis acidiphila]